MTMAAHRTPTPPVPEVDAPVGGHPLDNPVYAALTGPHAHLAETLGRAMRYQHDVSPFAGLPDEPTTADWADLARLAGARVGRSRPCPAPTSSRHRTDGRSSSG